MDKATQFFESDKNWKKVLQFATEYKVEELESAKVKLNEYLHKQVDFAEQNENEMIEILVEKQNAFVDEKYKEVEEKYNRLFKLRDADYNEACRVMDNSNSAKDYESASNKFKAIGDYLDSKSRSIECGQKCRKLEEEMRREHEEIRVIERRRKKKEVFIILAAIAVFYIVYSIIHNKITAENNEKLYNSAVEQYNDGQYQMAVENFVKLSGYEDSDYYVNIITEMLVDEARQTMIGKEFYGKYVADDRDDDKEVWVTISDENYCSVHVESISDDGDKFSHSQMQVPYEISGDNGVIYFIWTDCYLTSPDERFVVTIDGEDITLKTGNYLKGRGMEMNLEQ